MKLKQFTLPIVLFVFGMVFAILGALFKIQHWLYGNELLTFGVVLEVFSFFILAVILIRYFKKK